MNTKNILYIIAIIFLWISAFFFYKDVWSFGTTSLLTSVGIVVYNCWEEIKKC